MGCGASNSAPPYHQDKAPLVLHDAGVQTEGPGDVPKGVSAAGAAVTPRGPAQVLDVEHTWHNVCESLDVPKGQENPNKNLVIKRTGWKTIRIFVSSTFKDFHSERELLVKEVSYVSTALSYVYL